jgi:hypothetical protein
MAGFKPAPAIGHAELDYGAKLSLELLYSHNLR